MGMLACRPAPDTTVVLKERRTKRSRTLRNRPVKFNRGKIECPGAVQVSERNDVLDESFDNCRAKVTLGRRVAEAGLTCRVKGVRV